MKVVTTRVVSMFGVRAAWAAAAVWVILALGGLVVKARGVVPAGLVSWWQAEGNALDAQAANSGALLGPVAFVPGRVGQAFRFDGNGYVEVLSSAALEPSTVTVAAWVRGVAPGAGRYILSKGAFGCFAASYALYTGSNGELYFYVSDGNSFTLSPSAGTAVWDGQWHFVAGTFEDPATVRLYVDGVEVGGGVPTAIQINYAAPTNDKLYIGAYRSPYNYSFTGDIDEVQIYDRALAASEILSLFQNASVGFTSLTSTGAAVPGAAGVFTSFPQSPAFSGAVGAFLGLGSAGTQGIYLGDVSVPPNPIRVADGTTLIPQGVGTFTSFSDLVISDVAQPNPPPIRVGFIGNGASQQGVYSCDAASPTDPCRLLVNLTTAIPQGTGNFTGFDALAASGTLTSFIGTGTGQAGVYSCDAAQPVDPCRLLANLNTAIPGGTGNFTGFSALTTSLGHTAFLGQGSSGQAGIYLASTLTKVIAVGDQLAGKTVAALRLGRFGLDGHTLAFTAVFADGSEAVFAAGVNVLTFDFSGFFEPLENLPAVNLVKAGQSVPVKFSLGGNRGLDIFVPSYPRSEQIACVSGAEVNGVDATASAGASTLSYDPATDQYTYAWKTNKGLGEYLPPARPEAPGRQCPQGQLHV